MPKDKTETAAPPTFELHEDEYYEVNVPVTIETIDKKTKAVVKVPGKAKEVWHIIDIYTRKWANPPEKMVKFGTPHGTKDHNYDEFVKLLGQYEAVLQS